MPKLTFLLKTTQKTFVFSGSRQRSNLK